MESVFLTNLYNETMRLMEDVRDYHRHSERGDRRALPFDDACDMSRECLSMTARLTSVMAWVITQQAVRAGELTCEEAKSLGSRLMEDAIHVPSTAEQAHLPLRLCRLLDLSHRLYQRVRRIDATRLIH